MSVLTLFLVEALWGFAIYLVARKAGLQPSPLAAALVLITAAPALTQAAWGVVFAVEPGSPTTADRPKLIAEMLSYLFYASIALSLAAPVLAKGYRVPAAIFALPQIPLAWLVGFLGVMQVTGVWL